MTFELTDETPRLADLDASKEEADPTVAGRGVKVRPAVKPL